ncbi:MAG: carbohydrate ABC transporter permease [Treponema sp.]|nr:carbohydrate ABC transporter permease [Treponema sp.]
MNINIGALILLVAVAIGAFTFSLHMLIRKRFSMTDFLIELAMVVICVLILYPVWNVTVISFNDAQDAMLGGIYLWPRQFSLESYRIVFMNPAIMQAFFITIMRTVIGTVTGVFFTSMVAYAFSKRYIFGSKFYITVGMITMFFGGGLIPYFILLRSIGLFDTFLVYIIPALFNFFFCIIFMTFFREMPASLEESAKIDGANDFGIFIKIILPLSMPVIATIALFSGVGHWNDFFAGVMFVIDPNLEPIQTFLFRVVSGADAARTVVGLPAGVQAQAVTALSVQLATMVVTTAPIIFIYPFLQRYFVKGVMIGAIKG